MTTVNPQTIDARFAKLALDGVSTVFNSVSGFSISISWQRSPVGTSPTGETLYSYGLSGMPAYGELLCSATLSKTDTSLFTWWDEISRSVVTPKNGTLTLFDQEGKPTMSFSIEGAVLTSLAVSDHGLAAPTAATVNASLNCLSYKKI
jgi:hypothetical protein